MLDPSNDFNPHLHRIPPSSTAYDSESYTTSHTHISLDAHNLKCLLNAPLKCNLKPVQVSLRPAANPRCVLAIELLLEFVAYCRKLLVTEKGSSSYTVYYLRRDNQQIIRRKSAHEKTWSKCWVCSVIFLLTFYDWHIFYRKLPCPFEWRGCKYKTLQQSNLDTHIRRQCVLFIFLLNHPHYESLMHPIFSLNIKSCVCTDSNDCDYRTHDPALLLKHRKRRHGYIPNRRRKPAKLSSNFIIPEVPSFHDSYPPPMSDMDLFVHFLADMEQLDALEFGFNQ